MKSLKYLVNGFPFTIQAAEYRPGVEIIYVRPKPVDISSSEYMLRNLSLMRKLYTSGEMKKYDIVQFNNTENFIQFKKYPHQISIAQSHGFDFGVCYQLYAKDEKNPIKWFLGNLINKLLGWRIRKKIHEFDIYYVSTPDMQEPVSREVRKDVKWLPNPIDTKKFTPEGAKIRLEGNPACFMPTRLHGDKKPEIGIKIFQEVIKPNFPEATLHLVEGPINWYLDEYKQKLSDPKTYFWHQFMPHDVLIQKLRGCDLMIGQFSIGALGLLELETMACGVPVLTYDRYEIKTLVKDLPDLALNILRDQEFREAYIQKNLEYVRSVHSPEAVGKQHWENIEPFLKKLKSE